MCIFYNSTFYLLNTDLKVNLQTLNFWSLKFATWLLNQWTNSQNRKINSEKNVFVFIF